MVSWLRFKEGKPQTKIMLVLLLVVMVIGSANLPILFYWRGNFLAKVDKKTISLEEFASRYKAARMGKGEEPASQVDPLVLREEMINAAGLEAYLREIEFFPSDDFVRARIREVPYFQKNGVFSPSLYEEWFQHILLSPEKYARLLRSESASQLMQKWMVDTEFLLPNEREEILSLQKERRKLRRVSCMLKDVSLSLNTTVQEEKEYYQAYRGHFFRPMQMGLEYVMGTKEDLWRLIDVSDAAIEQEFDKNKAQYQIPASLHFGIILFSSKEDGMKLRQLLVKNPKQFASFAERYSKDANRERAKAGGSVGWIEVDSIDPALVKTLRGMKEGAISPLMKLADGMYAIVKKYGEKSAAMPPLASVKERVKEILQRQAVDAKTAEWQRRPISVECFEDYKKRLSVASQQISAQPLEAYAELFGEEAVESLLAHIGEWKEGSMLPLLINHRRDVWFLCKLQTIVPEREETFEEAKKKVVAELHRLHARRYLREKLSGWLEELRRGEISLLALSQREQVALSDEFFVERNDQAFGAVFQWTVYKGRPTYGIIEGEDDLSLTELQAVIPWKPQSFLEEEENAWLTSDTQQLTREAFSMYLRTHKTIRYGSFEKLRSVVDAIERSLEDASQASSMGSNQ